MLCLEVHVLSVALIGLRCCLDWMVWLDGWIGWLDWMVGLDGWIAWIAWTWIANSRIARTELQGLDITAWN